MQGDLAVYTADFRRPSRRSQQVVALIIGAGMVLLWWGVCAAYDHTNMDVMNDYAIQYANNALHNAK